MQFPRAKRDLFMFLPSCLWDRVLGAFLTASEIDDVEFGLAKGSREGFRQSYLDNCM